MSKVYRETNTQPTETRTVSDLEAIRYGIGGMLVGPALFVGTTLFALPIATILMVYHLFAYAKFRTIQIGHNRLGVVSNRKYTSPFSQLREFFVGFCEIAWHETSARKNKGEHLVDWIFVIGFFCNFMILLFGPLVLSIVINA